MKKKSSFYLADIHTAINRIEEYTQGGKKKFLAEPMMQDAVLRNLAIVGEAVKKLPIALKDRYSTIPWKEIAGMRDILIHDYSQTNLHIVWQTIRHDLPPLLKTVEKMMKENN